MTARKTQPRMSKFEEWFRTFIEEKDLPIVEFEIEHDGIVHYLDNYDAVEIICNAMSPDDQEKVKDVIFRLDFMNGDINHFLKYITENYIKMNY